LFISVIIPVYHNAAGLAGCLEALGGQTYPRESFEIVVVNNDPDDDLGIGYQYDNLRIITEKKPGSYAARNKGIRESRGELLGFCDSDCLPDVGWIENAVKFFASNKDATILSGRVKLFFQDELNLSYAEKYEKIFAFRQQEYARTGGAATANMFARRDLFEKAGFFDEILLSGGDLEWGQRARVQGFPLDYSEEVLVGHPARKSVGELSKKARRVVSGYIVLNKADVRKNPRSAVYHGLSMIKPPLKAGKMIFSRKDFSLSDKIVVYFLEYYLKLVQLKEFVRLQAGGAPQR
jgi:GT2 family glycosyltransferase